MQNYHIDRQDLAIIAKGNGLSFNLKNIKGFVILLSSVLRSKIFILQ